MAATSHEVVWGRLLGRVVGNTAWGVGLALGVFMVGMGAGSLLARWRIGRGGNPKRWYVAVEGIIAVGALAADAAFVYAGLPSAYVAPGASGTARLAIDLVYAVLATGLPALAIGATYPFLVGAAVRERARLDEVTGLYRAGLVGGVLGVLVSGAVLVPRIGVDGAAICAAGLNLLTAGLAWRILRGGPVPAPEDGVLPSGLARPTMLFAAAGMFGLGAQVVWNRAIVPYAGVSTLTFSTIVAAYLVAQAIGMAIGGRQSAARSDSAAVISLALVPTVAMWCLAPIARLGAFVPARDVAPVAWMAGSALTVAVAVCPSAFLLGMVQARALRTVELDGVDWARGAAWVSGIGTMAAAVGAAGASLLLYPLLGPHGTLFALGIVGAFALLPFGRTTFALLGIVAAGSTMLLGPGPRWFLGPGWDEAHIYHVEHGVQDTVAIIRRDLPVEPDIRRLVSNGVSYSGSSVFAQRYMRLLAHLPALAARGQKRALVVCIGTGTTAAALLPYGHRHVDAVDISPSVWRVLGHFRGVNLDFERDSRVRVVVEDGERFLRGATARYDVITLEPPPPRAPGASSLYSREFYRTARARLARGGVLAQWLPLHGLTGWEMRVLVRTFVEAFPDATLHLAERNEAILLGGWGGARRDPVGSDARRLASPGVRRDLGRIGMDDEDPLVETLIADSRALREVSVGAPVLRAAWPAPELAPFAGPRRQETLDAWFEALAQRATPFAGTTAALLLPGVAPFVRIREGLEKETDRDAVSESLLAVLRRDPGDPYSQHMLGYGPLLERRLRRLPAAERPQVMSRIESQRSWAEKKLAEGN